MQAKTYKLYIYQNSVYTYYITFHGGATMEFLYFLEKIRMPFLNEFMLLVTKLGEETVFLAVAIIFFWCIDKYHGYYILSVGYFGTITNQFLKLWFRIPRPWILDENFTILEQARESASGYSFPSGHTQSAVGTFGSIAYTVKERAIRIPCILAAVLVGLSRMYIGVHTPLDVCVSVIIGVVLIFFLRPVFTTNQKKRFPILLGVMFILSVAFLCFVKFYPFPADIDVHNYQSGVKNAYTFLGTLFGLLIVYIVDEKWINFSTEAVWWAQILKAVFGFILVLIIKSGTKSTLNMIFGDSIGRSVRYFLVVITAGIIWPLSFRYFSKLGRKEQQ